MQLCVFAIQLCGFAIQLCAFDDSIMCWLFNDVCLSFTLLCLSILHSMMACCQSIIQYRSNIDWRLIPEPAKALLNRWQPLNAQGQQKWRWVRTEMRKDKRINDPMWPFNKKMDELSTSLNTVDWGGGYFNFAGHIHKNIRSSAVTTNTASCCYIIQLKILAPLKVEEMAWLFPFYRQGATSGMTTSSCIPRKRFRWSALSSGVKKCWKLKNCDRLAWLLLCANVYSYPLEFGSNEWSFERFSSFVRDTGRLFVYFSQQRLIVIVIVIVRNWTLPLGLFRTNFTMFPQAIGWDRTSAYIRRLRLSPLLISPARPIHVEIDHNTGNYVPYSFREVRGFFNVPC